MSGSDQGEIRAALEALFEGGATTPAIRAQPALLELDYVIAEATAEGTAEIDVEELARRCRLILYEVAGKLGSSQHDPSKGDGPAVQHYLGLEPGMSGASPARRKQLAARALDIQPDSLTHPRPGGSTISGLLDRLSKALIDLDENYRFQAQRREMRQRRLPQESALQVPWIEFFKAYYRVWAQVSGLEVDIRYALGERRKENTAAFEHFASTSLYFCAAFESRLAEHVEANGGLWLLTDLDLEEQLVDALWTIGHDHPLSGYDASVLRLALRDDVELAPFVRQLRAGDNEELRAIRERWGTWLESCRCPSDDTPSSACKPHRTANACSAFMKAIDDSWDELSDWYKTAGPRTLTARALMDKRFPEDAGDERLSRNS
jgi:hypothetical protein